MKMVLLHIRRLALKENRRGAVLNAARHPCCPECWLADLFVRVSISTYPWHERKHLPQRAPIEVGFLRGILHVDDVQKLQSLYGWVTVGTYTRMGDV